MSLRPLPAEKLIKALAKVGFKPVRQRDSHVIISKTVKKNIACARLDVD